MEYIRLIVMTESTKFSGKCVAGINVNNGEWVRLVSKDEKTHGAIAYKDLFYRNGGKCEVLDIVDVPIIGKCPDDIQPENILIDTSKYFEYVGKASVEDVLSIHPAEMNNNILGNKFAYVYEDQIDTVGYSLTLVEVQNLEILQVANPNGNPKTKVNFTYKGCRYTNMSVTDSRFFSVSSGVIYGNAILVISIGTPYNGKYYKFVSGIFV